MKVYPNTMKKYYFSAIHNGVLWLWKITLVFLLLFLLSCEKDDICVDGDTPYLIIRFYDKDDPEATKAVTSLRITGDGLSDPLSTVNRITTDSIAVPLRALESTTVFAFISDSVDDDDGLETGNTDIITLNYQVEEVFISRACGYIANYNDLDLDVADDGDLWIATELTEIINTTVTNEAAAHIHIYH